MLILFFVVIGFIAGYFLNLAAVSAVTVASLFVLAILIAKTREAEKLLTVIYGGSAFAVNLTMWATHYFVSGYTFIGDFLRGLLR